jgi:hypothetical protein
MTTRGRTIGASSNSISNRDRDRWAAATPEVPKIPEGTRTQRVASKSKGSLQKFCKFLDLKKI